MLIFCHSFCRASVTKLQQICSYWLNCNSSNRQSHFCRCCCSKLNFNNVLVKCCQFDINLLFAPELKRFSMVCNYSNMRNKRCFKKDVTYPRQRRHVSGVQIGLYIIFIITCSFVNVASIKDVC